ncbi:MAG: hypothetical protein ACOCZK_08140 [Planctomycetota bacterium]
MPGNQLRFISAVGPCSPVEASEHSEDGAALRRFAMTAYTGGPMSVAGWEYPVIVDLAGMRVSAKARPILKDHNQSLIVGHTDAVLAEDGRLNVTGMISGAGRVAQEVVAAADNGFPWQASIGATVRKAVFVPARRQAEVNGRTVTGPVYIARSSTLGEISFVALGADDDTEARLVAHHTHQSATMEIDHMDFEQWVAAQGFTLADLSDAQAEAMRTLHANLNAGGAGSEADDDDGPDPVLDLRAQLAAETTRVNAIREVCAGRHGEIEAKAIQDGWDRTKTELEVLRAERPTINANTGGTGPLDAKVLEAAVYMSAGLERLEQAFDERTLDAADQRFRSQLGLQRLLLEAARANGYGGIDVRDDMRGVLKAAFSNMSLPGIFSSVANKFLLEGFEGVESAWRSIAAIRNVRDFKQVTSYRLTGGFQYEEVGPDGELKHAEVGEEAYSNQAKTYGRMFAITRHDLINDDLGALTAVPRRLGRGGALKLNDVFWRTFLNNVAFFSTANKNYIDGADSALTLDGLTRAETAFLDLVDSDGNPLAVTPAVLLVPNALSTLASTLMRSTEIREDGGSAKSKYPITNPHAGKYRVERSSYLSNAQIPGHSAKAWYLLANPSDMPVIEVAFLNGQQRPTVESTDADFNTLGIQMRGYHDFGVALQEPRRGLKSQGEA